MFGKHIIWNTLQSMRCFHTGQKSFKQVLTKTLRIKHEDYYKRIDKVPEFYEMIYKLPLHYTLNVGKVMALITTAIVPSFCLEEYLNQSHKEDEIRFVANIAVDRSELVPFVTILLILNAFVYRCCHIATLRIYKNQKSYIAMVPSLIPRRNHQFHFTKGQTTENFKAFSIFRGITYRVNGKTMLFTPERFRKPSDLFEMLHSADSKKYKP